MLAWSSQGGLPRRIDHGQYLGLLVGLEAKRRNNTGSSLDGKGEEGIERSFEGAATPEYLGE